MNLIKYGRVGCWNLSAHQHMLNSQLHFLLPCPHPKWQGSCLQARILLVPHCMFSNKNKYFFKFCMIGKSYFMFRELVEIPVYSYDLFWRTWCWIYKHEMLTSTLHANHFYHSWRMLGKISLLIWNILKHIFINCSILAPIP